MALRRILVTGSGGQIGVELVDYLRRRCGTVIATDVSSEAQQYVNVVDKDQVRRAVEQHSPDCVVHLAAMLSARGEQDVAKTLEVNCRGTENVLEAAAAQRAPPLVFLPSSIAAYGGEDLDNVSEDVSMRPKTAYGVTKLYNELLGEYYAATKSLDVRVLRLPGIVSAKALPGGGTTDWAVDMYRAAANSTKYTCFVGPDTTMPMLYVRDLLRGVHDFLHTPRAQLTRRTYNLGGVSFSPSDLARDLSESESFLVSYEPDFRQAIADSWPRAIDDTAARTDWGWRPHYDLSSITLTMLHLLRQQQHHHGAPYDPPLQMTTTTPTSHDLTSIMRDRLRFPVESPLGLSTLDSTSR